MDVGAFVFGEVLFFAVDVAVDVVVEVAVLVVVAMVDVAIGISSVLKVHFEGSVERARGLVGRLPERACNCKVVFPALIELLLVNINP